MSGFPAFPRASALSALVAMLALTGCTNRITDVTPGSPNAAVAYGDAMALGEATASVRWSAIARDFIAAKPAAAKPNQQEAFRAFAYLALAQYRAVVAVDESPGRALHAAEQGAVAAASIVVLSALFPADAAFFESQLAHQESEVADLHHAPNAFVAGARIGRAVGAQVLELARSDGFSAPWTGTVPTGPGYWTSDFNPPRPPLLPLLGQMRPFFMESGDQFRPPPPPAFGSPAFLDALAEVRRFSDTRTAEQLRISQFWGMPTVAAFWNEEATKLIARYHLNERRAAHALALMHMAEMDANIACHDAKYTYWLIRPYKADSAIVTSIAKPNHPSYPSNHACVSGAAAYVLGALFPADASELAATADEAGESRLYAGIHYRFDKDAGLRIARQVASLALHRNIERTGGAGHH
jgi:hypothetical protein